MTSEDANTRRQAGLLDLPPELREQIYAHLLVKPQNIITMLSDFSYYQSEVDAHQPAITCVSRLLRAESLSSFYSANLFSAQLDQTEDLCVAKRWLYAIGDANIKDLRRLRFCGWTKIFFGHMLSRRFVRMDLDLWNREIRLGGDGDGGSGVDGEHPEVAKRSAILKESFRELIETRRGTPFDAEAIAALMDGFSRLCNAYV